MGGRRSRVGGAVAGAALTLGVFLNELGSNGWRAAAVLGGEDTARALGAGTRVAAAALLPELLLALALALALTAVVCVPWGAACAVAIGGRGGGLARSRAAGIACWSAATFAFLHVYYSAHQWLLPASSLGSSPLAWLTGALVPPFELRPARLVTSGCCATLVLLLAARAVCASRRLRLAALAGGVLLAAAVGGYERARRPGPPRRFEAPGNVVLLGVDSLQMNRLAIGGAPRDVAPRIDDFLRASHRFDNAWTPFARTYPSWLSILTGRYPARHGARFNLAPDEHLDPGNDYLAERLREAGYATFHATDETRFSIIRPRFGYDELLHPRMGLDDFLLGSFFDFSAANLLRQWHLGHDLFPAIANNRASVAYNPRLWTDNLLSGLDALPRDRPAFVSLHLCGNHWPFSAPGAYAHAARDPVDACLAMVDAQVGAILDWAQAAGLVGRAWIVLLSDHGDGWSGRAGDASNSHGDDFRSALANRVVLGVRGPGTTPGVSRELVRTIDVYPTLLDLLGLEVDEALIDGRSVAPALAGAPIEPRELFAETGVDRRSYDVRRLVASHAAWYAVDPRTRLIQMRPAGCAELGALKSYMHVRGEVRLVVTPALRRIELRAFDPASGCDLPGTPAVSDGEKAAMLRALAEHFALDGDQLLELAAERRFLTAAAEG